MQTILKFFKKDDAATRTNPFVSATMGKTAVVDRCWMDSNIELLPTIPGNFWLVDIIKETEHGRNRGCFVVNPIRPLIKQEDMPLRLVPTFFEKNFINGILVITPNADIREQNWIVPLPLKQKWRSEYSDIHAIVVDNRGTGIDFVDAGSIMPIRKFGSIQEIGRNPYMTHPNDPNQS